MVDLNYSLHSAQKPPVILQYRLIKLSTIVCAPYRQEKAQRRIPGAKSRTRTSLYVDKILIYEQRRAKDFLKVIYYAK